MVIALTPEQETWLTVHVARGEFPSVGDAVRQLIDERIAERAIEEGDDLSWAQPYVNEALDDVAQGRVISREEHRARTIARLAGAKI